MSELEKNMISDDEVEEATGGMLLDTTNTEFYVLEGYPYAAVNNNTGKIMAYFATPQAAEDYANSFGKDNSYNAMWVKPDVVRSLQANPNTCPQ